MLSSDKPNALTIQWVLGALALLGLFLLGLDKALLFDVDEGAFTEATREMLLSGDWGHTTLNGLDRFDKPIGVYWLQAISASVFGLNEFAWVSPGLNQTHQLTNKNPNITCITLNCYLYGESNSVHYDYFDYLGEKYAKHQYEPDSDMDFVQFKQTMKKEWDSRPKFDEGKWNWKSLLFWKKGC